MTTTNRTHPDQTRRPPIARTDLARNAAALVALWAVYAAVRGATAGDFVTATDNARAIIRMQADLGMPSEQALQRSVLDQAWLLRGANTYYLGVHFPVTIGFLAWVWFRLPTGFARVRNSLIATTLLGLVLHLLYPLKPPRMMDGFVDTAALLGPDPYELSISAGANQLAAMPSLHVGWALLVALGCISLGTTSWRWLAALHPLATLAVVVVTANHYWTDAIVAVAITLAAWHLSGEGRRRTRVFGHSDRTPLS